MFQNILYKHEIILWAIQVQPKYSTFDKPNLNAALL